MMVDAGQKLLWPNEVEIMHDEIIEGEFFDDADWHHD